MEMTEDGILIKPNQWQAGAAGREEGAKPGLGQSLYGEEDAPPRRRNRAGEKAWAGSYRDGRSH